MKKKNQTSILSVIKFKLKMQERKYFLRKEEACKKCVRKKSKIIIMKVKNRLHAKFNERENNTPLYGLTSFVDLGHKVPIFHSGSRTYLSIYLWRVTFG